MADDRPSRGSDQFPLRLPDGMREQIKAAAEKNGRSMNAEIVDRLEASFLPQNFEDATADQLRARLNAIIRVFAETEEDIRKMYEPK